MPTSGKDSFTNDSVSAYSSKDPPLARRVLIQRHSQRAELREHPDPVPLEVAPGTRPATLQELVHAEVARIMRRETLAETLDEGSPERLEVPRADSTVPDWDDFDDGGDEFGLSGYQLAVMEEDLILQDRQNHLDQASALETESEEDSGGESGTEDTVAT